jgi:hypothetical protein
MAASLEPVFANAIVGKIPPDDFLFAPGPIPGEGVALWIDEWSDISGNWMRTQYFVAMIHRGKPWPDAPPEPTGGKWKRSPDHDAAGNLYVWRTETEFAAVIKSYAFAKVPTKHLEHLAETIFKPALDDCIR